MIEDYFKIKDKVVVITGAGGLLGKQHAEIIAILEAYQFYWIKI